MIPSIECVGDEVGIPIYGTSDRCWIEWKEEENRDEALARSYGWDLLHPYIYCNFMVAPSDLLPEEVGDNSHYETEFVTVYVVNCRRWCKKYFMIAYGEIDEFDDIYHCVCLPYNKLNLLKFFSEYLCPLGTVKYRG